MGRRDARGLHILDGLPASNQRIRRRQIQIIRHPRRSGTRTGHLPLRLYRKKRQEEKRESFFGNIARLRIDNSLAVDAACSGNPGPMEYRGVHIASRQEVFHFGPTKGTNNIGEFLAIVHGLALLKQKGFDMPIYSDSVNAISWVRQKKCKTKLPRTAETEELFKLIERAEKWLRENTYTTRILKWETKEWGEIPADFGRK